MMKNVVDVVIGGIAYWLLGYGISYGEPSNPFLGLGSYATDLSDPYHMHGSGRQVEQRRAGRLGRTGGIHVS